MNNLNKLHSIVRRQFVALTKLSPNQSASVEFAATELENISNFKSESCEDETVQIYEGPDYDSDQTNRNRGRQSKKFAVSQAFWNPTLLKRSITAYN